MSLPNLAILRTGMVSGVGLSAPASCAAIRAALDNVQETHFIDDHGEWIMGSSVSLTQPWRGRTKLVKMLALAVQECLAGELGTNCQHIPLLLGVAELERPGRFEGLERLVADLEMELGCRFHPQSTVFAEGRISGASALQQARKLLQSSGVARVLIAGVDTLLVGTTLRAYEGQGRLLTEDNSDGFIAGEAAAAALVAVAAQGRGRQLCCVGLGFGQELATVNAEDLPLRADGLVRAIRMALAEAGYDMADLDFRLTDVSGEQYGFREATLALTRILRRRKESFDIWHPADCIGEVGAAIVPVMLTVAFFAVQKGYALGNKILCHAGNDAGNRVAWVLVYQ